MPEQIQHKDQGDLWNPQATFAVNGTATDPTTLILRVKDPSGTVTVTTESNPAALTSSSTPIARTATGVYKATITLNDAGYWFARFEGTGAVVATEETQVIVDPSEFYESAQLGTRSLVSLAETKDWLNQQNIDTNNDLELARVIVDISNRFHEEAGREFKADGTNPQTRTFIAEPAGRRLPWYIDGEYVGDYNPLRRRLKVGDMTAVTTVELLDTDWATVLDTPVLADVALLPSNRQSWEPITELEFHSDVTSLTHGMRVRVTGSWGFPAVPGDVRQAVLDAVAAVMDRDVEHYRQDLGAASQEGDAGTVVMIGGRTGSRLLSLPPASVAVAWRYRAATITVG